MTNLELAQQQGNQAAPNLLDAANAGELGGGGSLTSPKPSDVVGLVSLSKHNALSEAQLKIIKEKFDFIRGTSIEVIVVETGSNSYLYINDRVLARCKSVLQSLVEQKIAPQAGYTPEIIAAVSEVQPGWADASDDTSSGLYFTLANLYFNTVINNSSSIPGRINFLGYLDVSTDYILPGVFTLFGGDVVTDVGIDNTYPMSNLGYQPDNDIFSSEMPVKFTEPIITYGASLAPPNGIRFIVNDGEQPGPLVDTLLPASRVEFDGPVYIPIYFENVPDTGGFKVVAGEIQYPDTLSPEVASILSGEVANELHTWLEHFDYECLKKVIDAAESAPVIIDSLGHEYAIFTNTSDQGGDFQIIPAFASPVVLETYYIVNIPCISCFCSDEVVEP